MLLKVVVALVSLWLIWGSTFLATKIAIITIPPLLMVGACFLIAGLIIFSWSRIRSVRNSNNDSTQLTYKHRWKTAFLAGSAMIFGGQGGIVWGEQYVSYAELPNGITDIALLNTSNGTLNFDQGGYSITVSAHGTAI